MRGPEGPSNYESTPDKGVEKKEAVKTPVEKVESQERKNEAILQQYNRLKDTLKTQSAEKGKLEAQLARSREFMEYMQSGRRYNKLEGVLTPAGINKIKKENKHLETAFIALEVARQEDIQTNKLPLIEAKIKYTQLQIRDLTPQRNDIIQQNLEAGIKNLKQQEEEFKKKARDTSKNRVSLVEINRIRNEIAALQRTIPTTTERANTTETRRQELVIQELIEGGADDKLPDSIMDTQLNFIEVSEAERSFPGITNWLSNYHDKSAYSSTRELINEMEEYDFARR